MQRERETDYLRHLCIPQLVLLLHSVLHCTEQYDKAIALSDLVASEQVREGFCIKDVMDLGYVHTCIRDVLTKENEVICERT